MMRKPKVVILGTGGTIAGKAGSNTEMTGYQAGGNRYSDLDKCCSGNRLKLRM